MDKISRAICNSFNLRIYTATTLDTVKKICDIHETTPNAAYVLAKSITTTSLLSASLKVDSDQNLSFKITGNGPIKQVFVQCDAKGNIRGFVSHPQIDFHSKLKNISLNESIGAGVITVTKDLGLKKPYESIHPISYGEIAKDTALYLTQSEQIPSAVIIGLKFSNDGQIAASGGILIQTFPDTPENSIETIEQNIAGLSKSLAESLEEGNDIFDTVSEIFGGESIDILSQQNLKHNCRCSKELLFNVLRAISDKELKIMIEEDHGAQINCTFCRKNYIFTEDELKTLL